MLASCADTPTEAVNLATSMISILAPRYLVWVRALVTGIRHFFMVLCALYDSEVLFLNLHVFEY